MERVAYGLLSLSEEAKEAGSEKGVWDSEDLKYDMKALRTSHAFLFPYFCNI